MSQEELSDATGIPVYNIVRYENGGRAGTPRCERRADEFAAELLAPIRDVERALFALPIAASREIYLDQVDQISSLFQVPTWAIAKRIRGLQRYA